MYIRKRWIATLPYMALARAQRAMLSTFQCAHWRGISKLGTYCLRIFKSRDLTVDNCNVSLIY